MNRRTVLASLGVLATGAGCTTLGYAGNGSPPASRFEDEPCPSLGGGSERTICYHTMDDPPVYLVPSTERFVVDTEDKTVETVEFTLHDETARAFQFDPQRWVVVRRDGTEWYRAAPDGDPVIPEKRPLDGTHTWSLSLQPHPSPRAEDTTFVTADLEEGLHAFAVPGHLGDDDSDVTCLALFELVKR